jgi:hypothetical protein
MATRNFNSENADSNKTANKVQKHVFTALVAIFAYSLLGGRLNSREKRVLLGIG